uniref:ANK_REP_REGION domain-containing protein n=1 Tax=Macrostomum lignano TaxID=282301 RepID=A0A1I8GVL9_9PLAT
AGADPNATSKDAYTPLHAAAKEGHETVVRLLLDAGADPHAATRRGATPLHTAAKYDRAGVIRQLLLTTTSRSGPASAVKADANARGRNGLTPLHLAAHYHRLSAAQALLEAGASALCAASNGYTPVHIAARRGAVDLAACLLDAAASGAAVAASKSGFAPLHLAAQEGHAELCDLLVNRGARVDQASTGGVAPLHLAAQEDRLAVAESLVVHHGAQVDPTTRAGFTPLHAACFFGRLSTARFLLGHGAAASARDNAGGATPLHLAAQEGHLQLVLALLAAGVEPSPLNSRGHTPAQLARCRGHREVFEALRSSGGGSSQVRTWEEEELTTIEETVEMCRPDTLAEQNIVRESGGAGKISNLGKQRGESKSLDETTGDIERMGTLSAQKDAAVLDMVEPSSYASQYKEPEQLSPLTLTGSSKAAAAAAVTAGKDNTPTERLPVVSGFLVSFLVDARGGAMTGARCPGLRIVVPPNAATGPTRVTCRLLRPGRVSRPPQLNDGEGLACRILEFGCSCRSFASPVLLEVPHMAALRNSEREIVVYRSDTGETWKEHALEASEQAVLDVIGGFFGSPLESNEELRQRRIVRILTASLPQYFALVTRLRQEAALIGPEGGVIGASLANGRVQSVFPDGALTKKIRVGVQVFPIPSEAAARLFGGAGQRRIAASPVVTIEPRRRKFHKPITLTLPLPSAASASGLGASQTLRLLCSITGGAQPATWEDITGSTALSHVKDSVSFTTTVSARFWLVDCQNPAEAAEMAGKLYREAAAVPYMGRFVVYAKRTHPDEARLRCLCITDDRADKTLETAQGFERKAESREVEILDGRPLWIEGLDNLTAFHVAAEPRGLFDHQQQHQLQQPPFFTVRAFRENRLTCGARPRDADQPAAGRVAFLAEPQTTSATTAAICTLELALPDYSGPPISKAARPAPRAASDVAAPAESADEPELVAAVDPTHGVARSYTADEEAAARRAKTEAYLELVRTLEEQTPEPKPLATTSEFEDKESVDEAVVEPSKAPGSPEKRAKEGLNAVEELLARLDARPDQSMAPEAGTPEEVVDVPKSISQVQAQVHTPPETAAGVPIEEKLEKRDAIQDQSMAPEAVTPEEVVEVPKTVTQAQALPKATADVEETLHKLDVHQDQSMAPEAGTPEEVVEVPKIVGIAHAEQRRSSSVADEAAAEEPDDAADAEDKTQRDAQRRQAQPPTQLPVASAIEEASDRAADVVPAPAESPGDATRRHSLNSLMLRSMEFEESLRSEMRHVSIDDALNAPDATPQVEEKSISELTRSISGADTGSEAPTPVEETPSAVISFQQAADAEVADASEDVFLESASSASYTSASATEGEEEDDEETPSAGKPAFFRPEELPIGRGLFHEGGIRPEELVSPAKEDLTSAQQAGAAAFSRLVSAEYAYSRIEEKLDSPVQSPVDAYKKFPGAGGNSAAAGAVAASPLAERMTQITEEESIELKAKTKEVQTPAQDEQTTHEKEKASEPTVPTEQDRLDQKTVLDERIQHEKATVQKREAQSLAKLIQIMQKKIMEKLQDEALQADKAPELHEESAKEKILEMHVEPDLPKMVPGVHEEPAHAEEKVTEVSHEEPAHAEEKVTEVLHEEPAHAEENITEFLYEEPAHAEEK